MTYPNTFVPDDVKLIIWDLDDTLWDGLLAEGDDISPRRHVIDFIRDLSDFGIVPSICSKNDPVVAELKLRELGLWTYFVFPRIAFVPKGDMVQAIVSDAQLRYQNVAFVDDNPHYRAEVAATCPGIMIVDASNSTQVHSFIEAPRVAHSKFSKSRLADYRLLETRNVFARRTRWRTRSS